MPSPDESKNANDVAIRKSKPSEKRYAAGIDMLERANIRHDQKINKMPKDKRAAYIKNMIRKVKEANDLYAISNPVIRYEPTFTPYAETNNADFTINTTFGPKSFNGTNLDLLGVIMHEGVHSYDIHFKYNIDNVGSWKIHGTSISETRAYEMQEYILGSLTGENSKDHLHFYQNNYNKTKDLNGNWRIKSYPVFFKNISKP